MRRHRKVPGVDEVFLYFGLLKSQCCPVTARLTNTWKVNLGVEVENGDLKTCYSKQPVQF